MPHLLSARPARDEREERQIRALARSRHAPAGWIPRARMIVGVGSSKARVCASTGITDPCLWRRSTSVRKWPVSFTLMNNCMAFRGGSGQASAGRRRCRAWPSLRPTRSASESGTSSRCRRRSVNSGGHCSTGPTGVAVQSMEAMSAPISPPLANRAFMSGVKWAGRLLAVTVAFCISVLMLP